MPQHPQERISSASLPSSALVTIDIWSPGLGAGVRVLALPSHLPPHLFQLFGLITGSLSKVHDGQPKLNQTSRCELARGPLK
jgi:hypothetical protein